jgi:hypothetical protein
VCRQTNYTAVWRCIAYAANPCRGVVVKTCSKCGEAKPLTEFAIDGSKVDRRASWCKTCHREYGKTHYLANLSQYRTFRRKAKACKRQYVIDHRTPCPVCGSESDLHWHHRDPSTKLFDIATAHSRGWKALRAELAKCVCICGKHHHLYHSGDEYAVSIIDAAIAA